MAPGAEAWGVAEALCRVRGKPLEGDGCIAIEGAAEAACTGYKLPSWAADGW